MAGLDELFHRALEFPPAARADWLRQLHTQNHPRHAELVELLAAHESTGPLDDLRAFVDRSSDAADVPERIGAYQVVELIARGGMGAVYLGKRADGQFEQRVAIKLMRADMEDPLFREHFLNERRILARIEHPNISRLLDGGFTTAGQPYFVMEYVDGQPIDRYCEAHHLTLRARLELFRTVCQAVHHAHQYLVIHRDIKPANVLVGADGVAKLLDFGIARIIDADSTAARASTRPDMRLLTPEYASPELRSGEAVTTASDVFQLGLLLRRLVSATGVPRDINLIIAKATREEAPRRYTSAEQLGDDVLRFLNGMPVIARPDTFAYRTSRFVARHRIGVGAATAAVALLAVFAVIASVQARRATRERDHAEQVVTLLTGIFEAGNPRAERNANITVRDVLDRGVQRVQADFRGPPETRATLLHNLSRVYRELGLLEQARGLAAEALELRRASLSAGARDLVHSEQMLGVILTELGRADSAVPLLRAAVAAEEQYRGVSSEDYTAAIRDLAYALQVAGKRDEADQTYHHALSVFRDRRDTAKVEFAQILHNLGWLSSIRGRSDSAEHYFRRALAMRRQLLGARDPDVTSTMAALATLLQQSGRVADAESIAREVLQVNRTIYPEGHAQIGTDLLGLAKILASRGADPAADSLFREAQRGFDSLRTENPMLRAQAQNDYAVFLTQRRRFAEAEPLYAATLDLYRARFGDTHFSTDVVRTNLAWAIASQGRHAEAARLYDGTVSRLEAALPVTDSRVGQTTIDYGATLMNAGEHASAERVLRHALELETAGAPPEHWRIVRAQSLLASCLARQRRYADAEPLLLTAYAALKKTGMSNPYTRQAIQMLAALYQNWGRPEKASEYRALLR